MSPPVSNPDTRQKRFFRFRIRCPRCRTKHRWTRMHCPHCEDFNWRNPAVVGAVAIVVAVILFITMKFIFKSRTPLPPTLEQIAQPPKTGAMLQPSRSDADFFRRS